jgi:hypothetical protein
MTGIIAELLTRIYYETQEKPIYVVKNLFPHTQLAIEKEEAA